MKSQGAKHIVKGLAFSVSLALTGCAATGNDAPLFRDGRYVPSTGTPSAQTQPVTVPPIASAGSPVGNNATGIKPDTATRPRSGRVIRPVGASRGAAASAASAASADTTPDDEATNPQGGIALNFNQADIQDVVRTLSRFTGRQFLMDPRVKGQVTLASDGTVDPDTAYGMLASALRMQGFAIVDVGDVSRIVPVADAKLQGGAVNDPQAGGGIATRTFRLAYEDAEAMVNVLKPMIAPENTITAYPANNTLVVTDYVDNLERIARIIESIDTPTSLDTQVVKVYNGIAVDIAGLANDLLQQGGQNASQDMAVLADPRSNSVIIRSSSPARTALARDLVVQIDNAQEDPGNLHVVYLRNAQSTALANVLRGLLTGESGTGSALGNDDSARAALGAGGMTAGGGAISGSNTNRSGSTGSSSAAGSLTGGGSQRFGQTAGASNAANSDTAFSANGVTVQADPTTNTLIISAPEPMYRSLRRVIDLLDQRRAQVLVESLIVEVNESDAAELGIQWMRQGGRFIGGANLGGAGLNMNAGNTIDLLPRGLNLGIINGSINLPGVGEIMNLEVLARALQTKGGANILSTPNILTLDNEAASIMVGKTVPFVSGQYITPGGGGSDNPFQTVEREDIGLRLQIRPQISEGGAVKLDIYQEVSSIDETNSGVNGIVTNKRAIDTSVLLDDGQIMVLGGLLEDSVSSTSDAVPVLGSIPILGQLFRYENRQRVKTNLMVFLRPYVIRDANAGAGLTQNRYNFIRSVQSQVQPGRHPLLPDMSAPLLPPSDLPVAGTPSLDLRPENWEQTREQPVPPTQQSSQARAMPLPPTEPTPVVRSRLPANVGLSSDLVSIHATASQKNVMQIADVTQESDATRIAQRVRISGLPAYIVVGPGGAGYAVRVDLPRDANAVDNATQVLRELGYQPELVVSP